MLKHRIITAVIIVIPIIWLIWFGSAQNMMLAAGAVVVLAGLEWARFSELEEVTGNQIFLVALVASMAAGLGVVGYDQGAITNHSGLNAILVVAGLLWLAIFFWVRGYPNTTALLRGLAGNQSKNQLYSSVARGLLGILILVSMWLSLIAIKGLENGHWLLIWLVVIVTGADIGAYFSGRRWGKNKLAPMVSPNKSWEGFWGGLVTNIVMSLIIGVAFVSLTFTELLGFMGVAVVTSVASVLGDLCESMLKRDQDIKDSGAILPGHGGVMDRMDSLTAAAPVFALSLMATGWL